MQGCPELIHRIGIGANPDFFFFFFKHQIYIKPDPFAILFLFALGTAAVKNAWLRSIKKLTAKQPAS